MTDTIRLESFFTNEELKKREFWKVLFFINLSLSWVAWFYESTNSVIAFAPTSLQWSVFFFSLMAYPALYFYVSYVKQRSILLTLSLIGLWCSLFVLLYYVVIGDIQIKGLMKEGFEKKLFYLSTLLSIPALFLTISLRRMNKAYRAYVKFPHKAEIAAQPLRMSASIEELRVHYRESIKECPEVKAYLKRLYRIREAEIAQTNLEQGS